MKVLSLGAGVQSTTLALLAATGHMEEVPDCAVFADTQSEPRSVYRHLSWLKAQLPFPVHVVTAGSLRLAILGAMQGNARMDGRPPFFTEAGGMLRRQCTGDFKIDPIQKWIRAALGLSPGQRWTRDDPCELWLGISTDEVLRVKPSRVPYIVHRWPLIEGDMSRRQCIEWLANHGYPTPPKSACTFCPYHSDAMWRDMRANDPEAFADAVAIDEAIRPGMPGPRRPDNDAWYVHRSRSPLADVDLRSAAEMGQGDLFDNECEGMCGL